MPDLEIDGITVSLSNLDKVFFPDSGITKGDLIAYYHRIAPTMLPLIAGRPINMHRFPDGIDKEGFFQQEVSDYFPPWVKRVPVPRKSGGAIDHVICDSAATLAYLANQGCVTLHAWLSHAGTLNHPDRLIFDLDPPADDFEKVRQGALALRDLTEELELPSFLMTTGSRGLHVVIPLDGSWEFDAVRDFARDLARVLAHRQPDDLTVEQRKEERRGRLFLDYLRNSYGQTAVAPYSVRARPGAPVATPLEWRELQDRHLHSQRYNVRNIFRRLEQKEDPWQIIDEAPQSLHRARQKLDEMLAQAKLGPPQKGA